MLNKITVPITLNTLQLKISIITVCKNSERYLQETITSVQEQTYDAIEYIIVDGISTDSTLEIVKHNRQTVDILISEADSGMYDAINKGLRVASGDYILVLNSDDVLASKNVIAKVVDQIGKRRLDYYYGNMVKLTDGKCKNVKLFPVSAKKLLLSTHGTFVPHPCFFVSKSLNETLAGYSLDYKYASDFDYILRALKSENVKGSYLNNYITKFRIHENSITASGKIDLERKEILLKHGYYKYSYLTRSFYYYRLWLYYKIINLGHLYKAG